MTAVWELAVRALHLIGLTLAPTFFSPEPLPPLAENLLTHGLAACAVFALITVAMIWFRRSIDSVQATVALVLWFGTVVGAFLCARAYASDGAPLLGGAPVMAAPVWGTLAAIAAALAGRFMGSTWKNKRMGAAIAVFVVGVFQLKQASASLADSDTLWTEALDREPGHPLAVSQLWPRWRDRGVPPRAQKDADDCLRRSPEACGCLSLRAEVRLAKETYELAAEDAQAAVDLGCSERAHALGILARARLHSGDASAAERVAREGLAAGGQAGELNYVLALALDRQGRSADAADVAILAAELGQGRDAELLAGALAIARGDLDGARRWLTPLGRQRPVDPRVAYNLALVADREGDYNAAREGYLQALRADPELAEARHNVALLTWRAGVIKEAHHHASRFLEAFPTDPRGPELARTVGLPPR